MPSSTVTKRSQTRPAKAEPVERRASSPPGRLRSLVNSYLRESRRPLVSLGFILPLLIVYEGGLVFLGTQVNRNGADVWLRQFLDWLGFGQYFLLPALTLSLLLACHHVSRGRWQVSLNTVVLMFAECALLALVLLILARAQAVVIAKYVDLPVQSTAVAEIQPSAALAGKMVGFLGAGVYEETLFRLLLVPPVLALAVRLSLPRGSRVFAAVAISSLLFAAAHYVGPRGELFDAISFSFRLTAGAFFALLFVVRGFGVAAGAHALFDIFVSLG